MTRTFVLVHGAWHGGWCWRRVADLLEGRGHKVFAPTLTGLGERAHLLTANVNLSTHVTDIVNVLKWENLSDVVLCGHSYGGLVIAGVAEQMQAAIGSIVFLDAFVPLDGDSVQALTSQAVRGALRAGREKGEIGIAPRPAEAFGVNARDRAWIDSKCTAQPIGAFTEKIRLTGAYNRIPGKTFIRAASYVNPGFDQALSRVKDDPSWRTFHATSGHDVMVDAPEWLADILVAA